MTTTTPANAKVSPPIWSNLTRADLTTLYRQIRQALLLTQSPLVTDNANVVTVRLTLDEKRCLESLAALTHQTLSNELRKAIRHYLQQHQHALVQHGGFTP